MRIIIIRHAEPDYENNTLTEKGFREAKYLGEFYKDAHFDAIYTSPLPRAKLTADALANGREVIVKDYLKEFWHMVKIDGNPRRHNWDFYPEELDRHPEIYTDEFLTSEIGQSANLKELYDEVIKEFDQTIEEHGYQRMGGHYKAIRRNKDTIVFVCHLGMMSVLMSRLCHIPYTTIAQHFFVAPSGVTIFVSEEREEGHVQFRCREFGNLEHLHVKNEPFSKFGSFAETFDSDDEMH